MNDENQFYLTLPSNSTGDSTASEFQTRLAQRVDLEGSWEVGLVELIYPNTWNNIVNESGRNYISMKKVVTNTHLNVKVDEGRYEDLKNLLESLNAVLLLTEEPFSMGLKNSDIYFTSDKFTNKVLLTFNPRKYSNVMLSRHLLYMLGFSEQQFKDIDYEHEKDFIVIYGKYPVDMRGVTHSLFVYCDIVQPQLVGNTLAPLLRVVNVEGKYMDIIDRIYDSPHYLPLLKKNFNTVEINIKNDLNEMINFISGTTIVKLHFRKVRQHLF